MKELIQSMLIELVCEHDFTVAGAIGYITLTAVKEAAVMYPEITEFLNSEETTIHEVELEL
jgi:hypothetical protein